MSNKIEKTLSFKAEDGGVSQLMSKLTNQAETYSKQIIQSAQNQSKSSKELISNIEKQLQLLERKQKLERDASIKRIQNEANEAIIASRQEFTDFKNGNIPLPKGKRPYLEGHAMNDPEYRNHLISQEEKKMTSSVAGIRDEANEEIKSLNEQAELQTDLLRKLLEESKKEFAHKLEEANDSNSEKNFNAAIINGSGIRNTHKPIPNGDDSNSQVGGGTDKGKGWKDVMKGVLGAEAIKEIGRSLQRGFGAFQQTQSGTEFVEAEMFTAIPFVGQGLAAGKKRYLEQRQAREVSLNKLRATSGYSGDNIRDIGIGVDGVEGTNFASQMVSARGYDGNTSNATKNYMRFGKAYNISDQNLLSRANSDAYTKNVGASGMIELVNQLKSNKSMGGDTSRLEKLLELQNQLIEEQGSYSNTVDDSQIAKTIAAFSRLSGGFSDNRASGLIKQVSSGLRAPSNDYQQAQNYAVLSQLNPNADFFEMQKMQEGGFQTPGFMKKTLDLYKQQYKGQDGIGKYALMKRFGLNTGAAESMWDGNFDDTFATKRSENLGTVSYRAQGNTSKIEQERANINEEFAKGMLPGLKEAGKQIASDIAEAIRGLTKDSMLFEGMGKKMAKGIEEYLGSDASGLHNSTRR
jgi:hypothetical protein